MSDFPIENRAKKGNRTLVSDSAGRCNTIIRFSHYAVQEKGVEPSSEHWKCPIFSRYTTPAFVVGKVGIEPTIFCV